MKNYTEILIEKMKFEKVLRSITPQYDMIVIKIEEIKDLAIMRKEVLQGSLEARELRLNQRETRKNSKQALIAHLKKEVFDDIKRMWKHEKEKYQKKPLKIA